jgi:hypothetical protein
MRFAAIAHFAEGSSSTEDSPESLHADSPEKAARKWFWRLSEVQRATCERIVLSAWTGNQNAPWERYGGPDVAFYPKRGWASEPA